MKQNKTQLFILLTVCIFAISGCNTLEKIFSSKQKPDDLPVEEYEANPKAKKKNKHTKVDTIVHKPTAPTQEQDKIYKKNWADKSRKTEAVVRTAQTYLSSPYRWGGMSKEGVDCSGLIVLAYRAIGMEPPRTSDKQALIGRAVSTKELAPGDILFFAASKPGVIGHSALVVENHSGKVKFIHATTGYGVRYDFLPNEHWSKLFISARRYL